jgi:dTMP kinase
MTYDFIVLEGIDKAGKHTQAVRLQQRLSALPGNAGRSTSLFEFPDYATHTGKAIGLLHQNLWRVQTSPAILHLLHKGQDPYFEQFIDTPGYEPFLKHLIHQALQTCSRLEKLPMLEEALEAGPVICDRYWYSALAYGLAGGLPYEMLQKLGRPMPIPSMAIYLAIPREESFRRQPAGRDNIERNTELLDRVEALYAEIWGREATLKRHTTKWFTIDGTGTPDEVTERLMYCIRTNR